MGGDSNNEVLILPVNYIHHLGILLFEKMKVNKKGAGNRPLIFLNERLTVYEPKSKQLSLTRKKLFQE